MTFSWDKNDLRWEIWSQSSEDLLLYSTTFRGHCPNKLSELLKYQFGTWLHMVARIPTPGLLLNSSVIRQLNQWFLQRVGKMVIFVFQLTVSLLLEKTIGRFVNGLWEHKKIFTSSIHDGGTGQYVDQLFIGQRNWFS